MKTQRKKLEKLNLTQQSPFLEIHVGSRTYLQSAKIVMIAADISYSYIYLSDGKRIIVSTNIQKLEERFLQHENMVRVHRSFMINTQYLQHVDGVNAFLINDIQCVISRRKRNDLFNVIQINN